MERFMVLVLVLSPFLANSQNADIVIADMAILGPREGQVNIEPYENAQFVFWVQNCGDTPKNNLRVTMEFGENTRHISGNPSRIIPQLYPGDYGRLSITLRSSTENIEVFFTIEVEDITYTAEIIYELYDPIRKTSEHQLVADCQNPYKELQIEEIPEPPIIAVTDDLQVEEEEITEKVRDRNPHSAGLSFFGASSVAAIGIGTHYYLSANNKYKKYKTAREDATELSEQIESEDLIWKAAFVASIPLMIMTTVKAVQFRRENRSFEVTALPVKNGGVVSLTIKF